MIIILCLLIWSFIGVVPYQLMVLRFMYEENPKRLGFKHFLQGLPFGPIVILSLSIAILCCGCFDLIKKLYKI